MVIGIDASRANHEQRTGVENYAFFLIESLKELQNWRITELENTKKIEVILYSDVPLKGDLATLPPNWSSKVLRWPPKRLWTQVRLSWEMLVHPPDVLFVPAHVFPIIHPKKTVMTVHDVAAVKFPETYSWFERWYSVATARFALKHLWRIIVPSEFTKSELLELQNYRIEELEEKVSVVPHGYDVRYEKIENTVEIERVLKKYGVRKPFIMTVGRLEEKKNTGRMIEAFGELRRKNNFQFYNSSILQFLLVGQPGHGYEKVKQAIDVSPYKHDIITPGWVDADDIPYLMNAAEAFVFPSLYEGFGLPVLEAFACGTPVVIGRGSSLEEVAGEAAVVVDSMSVESIAAGISQVLTDEATRTTCVERGRKRLEQYSWQKAACGTLQVLLSP